MEETINALQPRPEDQVRRPLLMERLMGQLEIRICEIVRALIMTGIGIQILIEPDANFMGLRLLTRYASAVNIGLVFLTVGIVRTSAIFANGNWARYGPWARALGALIGALMWSQMFLSLLAIHPSDSATLGAPIFFVFTAVEFFTIYRAMATRTRHHGRYC